MSQKIDKTIKAKNKWCYYGAYTKNGKQIWYKKRGFSSKREAQKAESEFLDEIMRKKVDVKFQDLIKSYQVASKRKIKESTYRKNSYVFKRLNNEFPNYWLKDLNREVLQEFVDRLDSMYTKRYVEKIFYSMQSVFKYAVEMDYIESNPLQHVYRDMRVNEIEQPRKFWEQDDFKVFISYVDDATLKSLFMTLYYMGMRIGETMALQWKDIDFEQQTITVCKTSGAMDRLKNPPYTTPKTKNSYRTIKMPKVLCNKLLELRSEHETFTGFSDEKFVFGYIMPMPTENVRREFKKAIKRANSDKLNGVHLQDIRLHDLRHSHASYLINNMTEGFSDFDIANRLGDTVATLHNTYAHWFKKKDKHIVDFIDRDCML